MLSVQKLCEIFFLIFKLTHLFQCIYFTSLHVSINAMLIIRRFNCINTSSGMYRSASVTLWYDGEE
jgi:hypothetical protein